MKQRQSTRVAVLSKAMRIVDEDTRFEHNNRRILALEADNYQEQAVAAKDDEAFTLSDVIHRFCFHIRTDQCILG